MAPRLTVLYDGGCPLCRREIRFYRWIAAARPIRWVDASDPAEKLDQYGISREAALRVFHVLSDGGTVERRAAAFLRLWLALPGYRWLARWLLWSRALPLLEAAYARFARWHGTWRCRAGACAAGRPAPEQPGRPG